MPVATGAHIDSAAESRSWRRASARMWEHRAEITLGVLVVLVWWLVPPLLYRQVAAGPDAQLRAITDTRTVLLAGLLGLGVVLAFWLSGRADRNAACSAQAIEQLASDTLVVRLGGIYSLERIAKGSVRDHPMVMEVLSAFVRAHSHPVPALPEPVGMTPDTLAQANGQAAGERQPEARQPQQRPNPTVDVRAALTVLGRLPSRPDVDRADLANAYLPAAALPGTKLCGFRLVGANLNQANLAGADLERAQLQRATLQGAWLQKASLKEANLQAAHLEQADLQGADLRGAWLGPGQAGRREPDPGRPGTSQPGQGQPAGNRPAGGQPGGSGSARSGPAGGLAGAGQPGRREPDPGGLSGSVPGGGESPGGGAEGRQGHRGGPDRRAWPDPSAA